MLEDEGGERVKDSRSGPVNEARTDFSRRMCSSRSLRGTCGSAMSLSIEPQECTSRPHVQLKQKHSDGISFEASGKQHPDLLVSHPLGRHLQVYPSWTSPPPATNTQQSFTRSPGKRMASLSCALGNMIAGQRIVACWLPAL